MPYKAFSPGSITLFFVPRNTHRSYERNGSMGVSITTNLGAVTEIREGERLKVYINERLRRGTIQHLVARLWNFRGEIRTRLSLPVSQGFGMSGAAALSTSLAIGEAYGATYIDSLKIAHRAELEMRTGLGDIASQYFGGITIRLREGIPPYGIVDRIAVAEKDFRAVVLSGKMETSKVLTSQRRKIIEKYGLDAMREFLKDKTLENAFKIGRKFSRNIGIFSREVYDYMDICEHSTPCNIGNSLIILGDCPLPRGNVFYIKTGKGAMILE